MGAAAEQYPTFELGAPVPCLVSVPGEPMRRHSIRARRTVIGSGGEADFAILDPTVARRHALIREHRGKYLLSDLGSATGTSINGSDLKPKVEYPLTRANQIRIGDLHFTFLLPASATYHEARSSLRREVEIRGLVALAAVLAIVISYLMRPSVRKPHHEPQPPVARSINWLARLNQVRESAGLSPVQELDTLSAGDLNHAHYLVANQPAMIASGKLDASIHEEDPSKPYFTPEGKVAGAMSDIDAVRIAPTGSSDNPLSIDQWIDSPSRMALLDPALKGVGYGEYCENGICVAALNTRSAVEGSVTRSPIFYPPARATIANGTFHADKSRWLDTFAACGYQSPTGTPITLQLGGHEPVRLGKYSLERNGIAIAACAFDSDSYRGKDPVAADRLKTQLKYFGAIMLLPREPLVPGATYTVKLTASRQTYSWWFAVAP